MPEKIILLPKNKESKKGGPGIKSFDKRWWDKNPGFWRGQEITQKEKTCSRCGSIIPAGSPADITLSFPGSKPTKNDFKNMEYWHKNKNCHEK